MTDFKKSYVREEPKKSVGFGQFHSLDEDNLKWILPATLNAQEQSSDFWAEL